MKIDVVTIFPDYLAPLRLSLVGKAIATGTVQLGVHDLRSWTTDRHRTVDDTPYGGGAGMVMRPEPWGEALDALVPPGTTPVPRLVVPTPAGRPLTQAVAVELVRLGKETVTEQESVGGEVRKEEIELDCGARMWSLRRTSTRPSWRPASAQHTQRPDSLKVPNVHRSGTDGSPGRRQSNPLHW